jgi:hypothetical protein
VLGDTVAEDEWLLRFVQAMSHHKRSAPSPMLLLENFHDLFDNILHTLSSSSSVKDIMPYFRRLPNELQMHIFSFMLESPGGDVLFYHWAIDVLRKLHRWPEKSRHSIPCKGALFSRWTVVHEHSYLAGLYDERVEDSTEVRAGNDWDYVVLRSNDIGIVYMFLINSRRC